MADPDVQTPDMQTATGTPGPSENMSQGGLLDALRSRGTLPSMLPQQMMMQQQAPNGGLAVGSGMLNAASGGNAALNPYLQQHQEQQNKQFWQQREMARMQEHEQAKRVKREEAAFNISKDLLKSEQPDARKAGAQGVTRYMKSLGMQAPDSIVEALASRRMTDTELNSMYRDLHLGMDDQAIAIKYAGASPQDIQQARASKDNPVILKALGLKTPEDQLSQTYDLRIKAATALEKEQPKIHGDANTIGAVLMKHRELFKKDYAEGDGASQQQAYAAVDGEKKAHEEKMLRMKSEMDMDKLLMGLQFKRDNPNPLAAKPVPIQIKQKMLEPFARSQSVVSAVDMLETAVDEMEKIGALPKGNSVASQYQAKLYRSTVLKNHPAVLKFEQLWGPVVIGQIDRGMFDEKGVRAVQIFRKQIEAVDGMAPATSFKGYFKTVRDELARGGDEAIQNLEGLDNAPPDVLEQAKRMYLNTHGDKKKKSPSPLNPDKDPLGILR